jgi:hypothetical protein
LLPFDLVVLVVDSTLRLGQIQSFLGVKRKTMSVASDDAPSVGQPTTTETINNPHGLLWWDDTRPPPLQDISRDLSSMGPIAICLHDALQETTVLSSTNQKSEDGEQSLPDEHGSSSSSTQGEDVATPIRLDQTAVNRIVQSFGEAMMKNHQDQWTGTNDGGRGFPKDEPETRNMVTDAVLRGRLCHYNRMNGKWRLVLENVQLLPRKTLARNRRKRERNPFWISATDESLQPVQIPSLQVLAYNDIE